MRSNFHKIKTILLAGICLSCFPGRAKAAAEGADLVQVTIQYLPQNERRPVPFEFAKNHIVFRARVGGQEVWAILDNGFDRTVVDNGFAKSSGLKAEHPSSTILSLTGSLEAGLIKSALLEIPGQMKTQAPFLATDLSGISKMMGRPIALIIGKEYFDSLVFFISSTRRTFQLGPSGTVRVPPNAVRLELKNEEPQLAMPQLEVTLDGKTVSVGIDLGSNSQIALSTAAWDTLGLNHLATISGKLMGLDGGVIETKLATVERVLIGPITANNVDVTIATKHTFAGDGIIGLGIFSHFDFAIDVAAHSLWMSPVDSRATANAFASDVQIAISLYRSGALPEAVRRFSELDDRAKTPLELNILCWEKATSGIMLDSAVEQCRKAVDLSGREPSNLDSLGFALLRSGKVDDALTIYREAIDKGQIAASFMGRAIAYDRKGDAARARADLEEATRRDPSIRDLFASYGLILSESSNKASAR